MYKCICIKMDNETENDTLLYDNKIELLSNIISISIDIFTEYRYIIIVDYDNNKKCLVDTQLDNKDIILNILTNIK